MITRRLVCAALSLPPVVAFAQAFPGKPITLIVPNPPGGVVDTSARIVSDAAR